MLDAKLAVLSQQVQPLTRADVPVTLLFDLREQPRLENQGLPSQQLQTKRR